MPSSGRAGGAGSRANCGLGCVRPGAGAGTSSPPSASRSASSRVMERIGAVAFLVLCLAAIVLGVVFRKDVYLVLVWVRELGAWGKVAVVLLFGVVALPIAAGYTPLAIGSGMLWGLGMGYLVAFCGACLVGPCVGYGVCALVWRPWVHRTLLGEGEGAEDASQLSEKWLKRRRQARVFIELVQQRGFIVILLIRNTPIPYGIQNALFSVSGVPFLVFWLASALGQSVELFVWVFIGSTLKDLAALGTAPSRGEVIFLVVELAVSVAIIAVLIFLGKREFEKRDLEYQKRHAADHAAAAYASGEDAVVGSRSKGGTGAGDGGDGGDDVDDDDDGDAAAAVDDVGGDSASRPLLGS